MMELETAVPIRITIDGEVLHGQITPEKSPETAAAIVETLPLEGRPQRWGEEFYVPIPVDVEPEHSQAYVSVGDLAYWPEGNAFCLFYGPTPASDDDRPKPASPVNVVGSVETVDVLHAIDSASELQVERRIQL